MKPSEDYALVPDDIVFELGLLIVKGRVTQNAKSNMPSYYNCSSAETSGVSSYKKEGFLSTWKSSETMYIEVWLYCEEQFNEEEAMRGGLGYLFIEQWMIEIKQNTVSTSEAGYQYTEKMLIQAVKSKLYFSQLSAWLNLSKGEFPRCIYFRLCNPGNRTPLKKFSKGPEIHQFPRVNLTSSKSLLVSLHSLPRFDVQQDYPVFTWLLSDPPFETPEKLPEDKRTFSSDETPSSFQAHENEISKGSLNTNAVRKLEFSEPCSCPETRLGTSTDTTVTEKLVNDCVLCHLKTSNLYPQRPQTSVGSQKCCGKCCYKTCKTSSSDRVQNCCADTNSTDSLSYKEGKYDEVFGTRLSNSNKTGKFSSKLRRSLIKEQHGMTHQSLHGHKRLDSTKGAEAKPDFKENLCETARLSHLMSVHHKHERTRNVVLHEFAQKTICRLKSSKKVPDSVNQKTECVCMKSKASFANWKDPFPERPCDMCDLCDVCENLSRDSNAKLRYSSLAEVVCCEVDNRKSKFSSNEFAEELERKRSQMWPFVKGAKDDLSRFLPDVRQVLEKEYQRKATEKLRRYLSTQEGYGDQRQTMSKEDKKMGENNKSKTDKVYCDQRSLTSRHTQLTSRHHLRHASTGTLPVFHPSTGLPMSSSPGRAISVGRVSEGARVVVISGLQSAFRNTDAPFRKTREETTVDDICSPPSDPFNVQNLSNALSKSAPTLTTQKLLGNFEESVLNDRLLPHGVVEGFSAELSASGSRKCLAHVILPVQAYFFKLSDDNAPSPYMGYISLDAPELPRKGYHVPKKGTVQLTLFNPNQTVVKVFFVLYDFSDMQPNFQTFLRQKTTSLVESDSPVDRNHNTLHYLIHLRFASSKSGRVYLHTDIRLIFARHPPDHAYLKTTTSGPTNPKYVPRQDTMQM